MNERLGDMNNTVPRPSRVVPLLATVIMVTACSGGSAGSAVAQGAGSMQQSQRPPSALSSADATVDQPQSSATSQSTVFESPSASADPATPPTAASDAPTAESPTAE
jgi:hypothetical protein